MCAWVGRVMLGPVEEGRLRLDAATWGTMGVGLGYAVAAATTRPDRLVVAVEGDSAFGFSGMECETIARRAHAVLLPCRDAVRESCAFISSLCTSISRPICTWLIVRTDVREWRLRTADHQCRVQPGFKSRLGAPCTINLMLWDRYKLPIVIIVFNNNGIYGGDRRQQPLQEAAAAGAAAGGFSADPVPTAFVPNTRCGAAQGGVQVSRYWSQDCMSRQLDMARWQA